MTYDLDMTLYAMFANQDAVQVVEQILPEAEWTNSVVYELDTYVDMRAIYTGMTIELYDGDFDTRRAIIYTFTFKIKDTYLGSNK